MEGRTYNPFNNTILVCITFIVGQNWVEKSMAKIKQMATKVKTHKTMLFPLHGGRVLLYGQHLFLPWMFNAMVRAVGNLTDFPNPCHLGMENGVPPLQYRIYSHNERTFFFPEKHVQSWGVCLLCKVKFWTICFSAATTKKAAVSSERRTIDCDSKCAESYMK